MSKAQWIAIRVILSSSEDVIKIRFGKEIIRIQYEKLTKLQNLIEEE